MKKFPVLLTGLVAFSFASCQSSRTRPEQTLPPVVKKAPAENTAPKKKKRSYTAKKRSTKPKTESTATTVTDTESINPLTPDPIKVVNPVSDIPRFEVPENLQPKVSDGINQSVFIELQW